jgi:hypothetical protein
MSAFADKNKEGENTAMVRQEWASARPAGVDMRQDSEGPCN